MKILQGAAQAALARLDELASQNKASQESAQHLRKHYEARVRSITKRFKQVTDEPGEDHATTYQQLRGVLRNGELEANIPQTLSFPRFVCARWRKSR